MKKFLSLFIVIVFVVNLLSFSVVLSDSYGDCEVSLIPVMDTLINGATASNGSSAADNLVYTRWRSSVSNAKYSNYALLRFDISEIEKMKKIDSAVLRVYIASVGKNTKLKIYKQDDNWDESNLGKIASDIIPLSGTNPTSVAVQTVSVTNGQKGYLEIDITEYISEKYLAGASVVSLLMLPTTDSANVGFYTREDATRKPYLDIKSSTAIETVGGFTFDELESTYYLNYDDGRADAKPYIEEINTSTISQAEASVVYEFTSSGNLVFTIRNCTNF